MEISLSSIRAGDNHKGFGANFDELPDVDMSDCQTSKQQESQVSDGELPPPQEIKPVLFEAKPLEQDKQMLGSAEMVMRSIAKPVDKDIVLNVSIEQTESNIDKPAATAQQHNSNVLFD